MSTKLSPLSTSLDPDLYPEIYHFRILSGNSSLSAVAADHESKPTNSVPTNRRTVTVAAFVELLGRLDVKFVHTDGFVLGLGNNMIGSGGYATVQYHEMEIKDSKSAAVAIKEDRKSVV